MKRKIYYVLLAALLLSANVFSAQVAKLGDTNYEDIAAAISDWKTNGGTLQLLANCTYDDKSTALVVTKESELDLNDFTLTWNCSNKYQAIDANASFGIYGGEKSKGAIVFNMSAATQGTAIYCRNNADLILKVRGTTIVANFTHTNAGRGRAIWVEKGTAQIWNNTIKLQGNGSVGIFFGANSKVGMCENNTIVYEPADVKMDSYIVCYGIQADVSFNSINNKIDLSQVRSDKRNADYALYVENGAEVRVIDDNSLYKVNTHEGSSPVGVLGTPAPVISLEGGTFTGPAAVTATSISGGKYSVRPDEKMLAAGYIFQQVGGTGVYKDYYTPVVDEGQVVASVYGEYYFSEATLWDEVYEGDEVVLYTTNPIAVPADKDITLTPHDPATVYNITNNGTIRVAGTTLLANMTNKGKITIEGNGVYPETYYNSYVKGNVVDGNQVYYDADAKKYHVVLSGIEVICGETPFTKISYAFRDVKDGEAIVLMKDVSLSRSYYTINGGKHIVLNLNGHTLSGVYSKAALHIQNASLAVKNGSIKTSKVDAVAEGASYCFFYLYGDTLNANAKDFSVLTLAEDVTVETPGTAIGVMYRQKDTKVYPQSYGVRVDIDATIKGEAAISVSGVLSNTKGNVPEITIGEKAHFDVTDGGIYAAGYAKWTYAGTINTDNFGVEVRAGEFTMNGGSIISTATKPADDQFNGSGSTSQATAIAACQHSTKLPIKVLVEGGLLKAYTPIYQANPQNNESEYINSVSVVVDSARVFSTSKNIVWSANKRITLNGGVYNLSPSQYVAEGKVVVENKDATYPYTIDDKPAEITFNKENGNWNNVANWSNTTGATPATPVVIAANVVIPDGVTAEAYGIKVETGKTITIKNGGKLLVGKEGIAGLSGADQLKIEDGGILAISPAAESNNQPQASVVKSLNTYKKAAGTYVEGVEDEYVRCYMGGVTIAKPQVKKDYTWFGNYWDYRAGWQETSLEGVSILCEPFKGFAVATASASAPATPVTMQGTLVGNADAHMSMPGEGFHFFANSWMAPLDAYEVLNQLDKLRNEGKVESSIKILLPLDVSVGDDDWSAGTFVDINRNFLRLGNYSEYWGTIAPMAGFFLRANEPVNIDLTYENAVWNALQVSSSTPSKSVRRSSESAGITGVQIRLTASDGSKDRLYVFNGDPIESCTKMMNDVPNVNIYVANAGGKYSTYATEDLSGTEIGIQSNSSTEYVLSFGYTEGEILYLKDLQTGIVTEMSDGNSYIFTADANTTTSRFRIVSRSEVTTGVDGTTAETTAATAKGIYSVTGQYLGDADQQSALPAGVYIINGKKVVK